MTEASAAGSPRTFAVLGIFDGPQGLMDAIPRVKEKGLGKLEAYTPYPIHGIEKALGLRRSPLGGMVMVMAIVGVITAFVLQAWPSAVDYPIITSGKVPLSWEAFLPIIFEVMVLFATLTAGLGMLFLLNRLPRFRHPMLGSEAIAGITRDRFALAVEAEGTAEVDVERARGELEAAGAASVEVVRYPEPLGRVSAAYVKGALLSIFLACFVAGLATYWAVKLFPVLPPMAHMQDQPRVDPYESSAFFGNQRSMQRPVEGTVARGHLPYTIRDQKEAAALVNPLPRTKSILLRGKKIFSDRCIVCHGPLADGKGSLTAAYGAAPANLTAQTFREGYTDGEMYHVLMKGKNAMPSQAADIAEDDRWAVIHYVRALQRAQRAKDSDVEEALKQ